MPVVWRPASISCAPGPTRTKRAAAEALRLAVSRLESDQRTKDSDRTARLAQFHREVTRLDGDIRTAEATLARLSHTLDQTQVRAPITGTLGEVATLQPGAVVRPGTPWAWSSCWRVAGGGALSPGHRPGPGAARAAGGCGWTVFHGHNTELAATVTSVATEARDGVIRVELQLPPETPTAIPLQHGLPGTVEVEVERISPATLVLRAVGTRLGVSTRRAAATGPQGGAS